MNFQRYPALLLVVVVLLIAGCAMPEESGPMDGNGMDPDVMGMGAETTSLAMATLDEVPEGELAWVAYDLGTAGFDELTHTHGPAFALAVDGTHEVPTAEGTRTLEPGEAAFVPGGEEHTHTGTAGLWEIHLKNPGEGAPEDLDQAERVFESPSLEGVPEAPVELRFVHVMLPPGGETDVHQHPGPEYIYVTTGDVTYESSTTDGPIVLKPGDDHALPAGEAVQKRNPTEEDAAFLSLFIVDPDEPFVQDASFEGGSG